MIVDPQAMFRCGLAEVLSREPDMELVAEASAVVEAVAMVVAFAPDLVIVEARLSDGTGEAACTAIKEVGPEVSVLFLTGSDTDADFVSAIRAGANGYLLKSAPESELAGMIRRVHAGGMAMPEDMVGVLMHAFPRSGTLLPPERSAGVVDGAAADNPDTGRAW